MTQTTDVVQIPSSTNNRLRARRQRVSQSGQMPIRVRLTPGVHGRAINTSLHGALVRVKANNVPLPGDTAPLSLSTLDTRLYEGRARVVHVQRAGEDYDLGLELTGPALDVAALTRSQWRSNIKAALTDVAMPLDAIEVKPQFKVWLSDLGLWLERMRDFLGKHEQARRANVGLDEHTRVSWLNILTQEAAATLMSRLSSAARELGALTDGFDEDEHRVHRAYLQARLGHLIRLAPIARRALDKPLGYAGDYELMNMFYRPHDEGETVFGRALNLYYLSEAGVRANINRISFLGGVIERAFNKRSAGERLRVMSVGCGPAREIYALLQKRPELGPHLEVVLVDQEAAALSYVERTVGPLATETGARVTCVQQSVRDLVRGDFGEGFDLIYAAGLFDYVGDRLFTRLAGVLFSALAPEGRLLIGNVSTENPSRAVMEYHGQWFLNHRGEETLVKLGASVAAVEQVEIEREPLGINLFLSIRKPKVAG